MATKTPTKADEHELSDEDRKKLQEHMQFLSNRYVINITLAKDNEPAKIFVGDGTTDWHIQRGVDVEVPGTVLHALDNAVVGVTEEDPNDPTKSVTVMRHRFPYTVKRVIERKAPAF
ncbi:MAG: hypothetical protein HY856_13625 [Burkholderiales bacterium]|nr:hypothetical protein [Burkholderiales bacterium]